MTRSGRRAATGAGALVLLACAGSPVSVFTSIRVSDCRPPAADIAARFAESDLGVQHCDGVQGWQVLVVSSAANSWIELRSPSTSWSSEDAVVYEQPIGLFPGVSSEQPLEWRVDSRHGPTALLFTVTAQDPEDAETRVSQVFVARLGDERACLIGRAATATAARTLADRASPCPPS